MPLIIIEGAVEGLEAPIDNSKETYAVYKGQVIASETAKMIFVALEKSPKKVGVLLIKQNFDSMYIPPFVFGTGAASGFTGGIAVVNITSELKIKDTVLPLGVSMMHELGHAKQYIDAPEAFATKYKQAMGQEKSDYPSQLRRGKTGEKISQLVIENENVAIHEAPICDDLGLPFRKRYD